jgi:hypothetical protein
MTTDEEKIRLEIERLRKKALADMVPLAQVVVDFTAAQLEEVRVRGTGDRVVIPGDVNPLAAVRQHFRLSRQELAGLAALYTSKTSQERRVLRTIGAMEKTGVPPRRTSMWTVALVPTLAALGLNVPQLEKALFAWAVQQGHVKLRKRKPLSPCFTSLGFGLGGGNP